MYAGPVRERRHDEGHILRPQTRHQVGDVICNDKTHLTVRQDRSFRMACRAGSKEKPAGIVMLNGHSFE